MNYESYQRAALFDLHGVLVHEHSYTLLEKISSIHTLWKTRSSINDFIKRSSSELQQAELEALTPGIVSLLQYLTDAQIPRAIVTHGRKVEAFRLYTKFNLDRWILPEHVVYRELTQNSKVTEEPFVYASTLLDVPLQNCVLFDDAVFAIDGALKAGIGRIYAVNQPLLLQRPNLIPLMSFEKLDYEQLFEFLDKS